ncbi:Oligopeptide transport ATP-binding protein OppF [Halomonas sp. THAF12]|uniref:ABC transporter ATP-binding protein n=1 Tax=Halomonas sp. THAF12 TaxID=2587849 RepID=UPI001267EC3C|nr:dipeptide/oligopeptide/nickel ABC transporter ATP-binding protein [Halomonas sp. THAF12]QFT84303.1 Oligopeptide transport ATP-binding protein OppF [Halomonas sp. THAF12]
MTMPELNDDGSLLRVSGVGKRMPGPRRWWGGRDWRHTLRDIDFRLYPGELIGLAGVSGAGKSTLLNLMLGLTRADGGEIVCRGRRIAPGSARALRWYRRVVQVIPQDPAASLDPRMRVGELIREPLVRLGIEGPHEVRVGEALEQVGLDGGYLMRRPAELSGGQAQRVAIARAMAVRPRLLLADEPLSGLDLPLQAQVTRVLKTLHHEAGIGLLLISHDLSVVCRLCQRTLVLDDGAIIEDRPTEALFRAPAHERTAALIRAAAMLPGQDLPPTSLTPGSLSAATPAHRSQELAP